MSYNKSLGKILQPILPLNNKELESEILYSNKPISPLGDIDPELGIVKDPESVIYGRQISGKILVAPYFRGSTVGPYILFALHKKGMAPKLIIVERIDPMLVTGCILSNIPLYKINSIQILKDLAGVKVKVNRSGEIYVREKPANSN